MDTPRRFHPFAVPSRLAVIVLVLSLSSGVVGGGANQVGAAPTCVTPTADYANLLEGSGHVTQRELNASCAAAASGPVTLTCAETAALYDDILAGSGYASRETGGVACGEPDAPVVRAPDAPVAQTGLRPR